MYIIYEFPVQLRRLLENDLSKVILYGSYTRGNFQENSDVNVMVLVKISPEGIEKIKESIFDLAFDIEMEHGIHILPIIRNYEQFDYWVEVLSFYRTVRNEGGFKYMNSRNATQEQLNAGKQNIIGNGLQNCNADKADVAKSLFGILPQEVDCNKAKAERLEEL